MSQSFLPFNRPSIGEEEINEVIATLKSEWLTTGPRTAQFEREFAAYVQARFSLAVNSCTAGLHLALLGLGIGPGDEVITTPLTFCATVNTILHVGAVPVLADIGPDGNIDPDCIQNKITERTKAIIPVHFAGLACQMDRIWALARAHRLFVIEDAAHAIGSHYQQQPIGASTYQGSPGSDAVAFSFYATKNLTTGEGGMVTTANQDLIEKMRILCLHGISKDAWNRYSERGKWFYQVVECGFKYNLSDIQSAIGIHQLRKQEDFLKTRTEYAHYYHQRFADVEEMETPVDSHYGRHSWHLYVLRLQLHRLQIGRDEFIEQLQQRGIGTSVHFIPIPLHPLFASSLSRIASSCEQALALYPRILSLPLYPAMNQFELERVADAVIDIVQRNRVTQSFSVSACV